jgi:AcrR family transcriptional regulator
MLLHISPLCAIMFAMRSPVEQPSPQSENRKTRRRAKIRDAEATRDEILTIATKEFAEKGLFGARVEEIAARTATSKHMIYYYFGSKDGLYAAVLERAYIGFRKAERAVDYDALTPDQALSTLLGNSFDAHVNNPQFVRILMSENLDSGRHTARIDHSGQRQLVIETTQRILDRGVAQGLFRSDITALNIHLGVSSLSFFFVANRYTFGTVFGIDMADPITVTEHRAEVIETMLSRCRI